jgi:hypothetical protein
MYVCMRGRSHLAPAPGPSLFYCASSLISPLGIPHFKWNAELYLWGLHKSHLVPWRTGPGDTILKELKPHSHKGHVWLIHLLGTFHKWDHPSIPIWKGVPLDDSVLWIVLLSILIGPCLISADPLFFWQRVLIWVPLPVWVQLWIPIYKLWLPVNEILATQKCMNPS